MKGGRRLAKPWIVKAGSYVRLTAKDAFEKRAKTAKKKKNCFFSHF